MSWPPRPNSKSPEQRAEGRAAEDAELLGVDLLEERALVELRRLLEVLQQVLLRDVEDLDLQRVLVSV